MREISNGVGTSFFLLLPVLGKAGEGHSTERERPNSKDSLAFGDGYLHIGFMRALCGCIREEVDRYTRVRMQVLAIESNSAAVTQ